MFAGDGARFVPLPAPSDHDVWRVLATVRRRIVRLARRHGIDVEGDGIVGGDLCDELAEESTLLAGLAGASVAGRSAIGADAGRHAVRLGRDGNAVSDDGSGAPCHAHIAGNACTQALPFPPPTGCLLAYTDESTMRAGFSVVAAASASAGRSVLPCRGHARRTSTAAQDHLRRSARSSGALASFVSRQR